MALLAGDKQTIIDVHEHFIKQTYRNRCVISGANGPISLTVPLQKKANHMQVKNLKINYAQKWQDLHWRSIASAYGKSPFFEFYRDELQFLFEKEFDLLADYNLTILQKLLKLLEINPNLSISEKYLENPEAIDLRNEIHPKRPFENPAILFSFPRYLQVFSDRFPYMKDLSVLDLLFNLGSESKSYLRKVCKS